MELKQLVHFTGRWTDIERSLVTGAIEDFESTSAMPLPRRVFGSPWICACYPSEQHGHILTAARHRAQAAIAARDAEELASRIRQTCC